MISRIGFRQTYSGVLPRLVSSSCHSLEIQLSYSDIPESGVTKWEVFYGHRNASNNLCCLVSAGKGSVNCAGVPRALV